ncbi:hypothetical protein [Halobacillus litoralis]|uniref:Uncharacterized protein n=1 Tax=Halobacillus litoralis TaxID=45668 RepID=A0A410MCS5_9BACI|nr:hypothetical protein [Halobacillus litoralis]QAS52521.1 hypothetical protein HLI_09965 [Halobacillus litoralis]
MNKWKTILIVSSLLIFGIGTYLYTGDSEGKLTHGRDSQPMRQAKAVDMDDLPLEWTEVESFEEVQSFYEERVPGLALAREEGLTTLPGESTPIKDRDGRMQINEVWHNGHTVQIFYSIDLSTFIGDDKEKNKFLNRPPSLEGIHIEESGDFEEQTFSTHSRELHPRDTVVFENRLYSMVQAPPITNSEWGYEYIPEEIKNFNQEIATSFDLRMDGETIRTEPLPVLYVHDKEKHIIGQYTTDETYSENGITIEPIEIKLGIASSQVKMRIEHDQADFNQSVQAFIRTETGEKVPLSHFSEQEDGLYVSSFQPFQEIPEKVSLEFEAIHLKEDKPYSFDVDMTQFQGFDSETKMIDEKVGEAYGTDIILKRVNTHGGHHMDMELNFKPHSNDQKKHLVGAALDYYQQPQETMERHVQVESNDGETVEGDFYGHDQQGNINFEAGKFRNSSTLSITVDQIVYAQSIDESFELVSKN